MPKTLKAEVDSQGRLRSEDGIELPPGTKVLVTVLGDVPETSLLSEQSLGSDWLRPEEDAAWSHLNQG